MPAEVSCFESRFKGAGVDWKLPSEYWWEKAVIFSHIQNKHLHHSKLIALNTDTGVLPAYSPRKAVRQPYEFAISFFRESDIEKCTLANEEISEQSEFMDV